MSLILEALRKSEAERQRGAAPSLYVEMPPAPTPASRFGPLWPMWIGLVVLLPLAAWLLDGMRRPAPVAPINPVPMASQPPILAQVRHLEAPTAPIPVRPDVPPPTEQSPIVKTPSAETPAPADDEPQSAAELAASIAARARAAGRIDHDSGTVARPPPPAMTSPMRTLSLSDLPADERKALPALRMSMHLWNEDASQRFVIIDGDRLHEGDRIGNVVVSAIVSDGVLLEWNGRQLKLPIR